MIPGHAPRLLGPRLKLLGLILLPPHLYAALGGKNPVLSGLLKLGILIFGHVQILINFLISGHGILAGLRSVAVRGEFRSELPLLEGGGLIHGIVLEGLALGQSVVLGLELGGVLLIDAILAAGIIVTLLLIEEGLGVKAPKGRDLFDPTLGLGDAVGIHDLVDVLCLRVLLLKITVIEVLILA